MSNLIVNIEEEWFTVNLEAKLNKKIDILQTLVHQQLGLIQKLFEEIKQLKKDLHVSPQTDDAISLTMIKKLSEEIKELRGEVQSTRAKPHFESLSEEIKELKGELHSTQNISATQNDRIHQLLEELKVLKQRELNMMLREKKPTPFVSENQLSLFPNLFSQNKIL